MRNPYCRGRIARLLIALMLPLPLLLTAGCSSVTYITLSVTASPSQLTIYPGQQKVPVSITVYGSGSSTPATVTLTGLPSGVTVTPATVAPGATGTLYLSASPSAGQSDISPTAISATTSWTTQATLVANKGQVQATTPFPLIVSISNSSFAPEQSAINLPIININTNGTPIVSTSTDVSGTITITSPDGSTTYLDDTAALHVHGNSTAEMPKLPYEFKLDDSIDLLNTMGLQCPYGKSGTTCDKSKTYVLLANYDDKSLLRDWSASALANAIPYGGDYLNETPVPSSYKGTIPTPSGTSTLMPWAPHSLFVELYLNGAYEGNYQLIEKVNVDSHRVNITELSESDISPSQVTGGYLMEIDHHEDEAYVFTTPQGVPIGLIDPDFTPDPEVPEQTAYITSYVDTAENALFSSNYTDPTQGWRAYFDEASAVNFYIVNEVMGNVDGGAFFSSDYLYKDVNNPFLYMGPVWDFDISSGNVNYESIVSPVVPWMQTQSPWYARWFTDPGFKADVVKQWNALQKNGVFTAWLASIQQESSSLQQSANNNFIRWPILGLEVWPNAEAAGSYNGEVNYLVNWLNLRIDYLDSQFNNKAQTSTSLTVSSGTLTAGAPVTLSASVSGTGSSLTGTVSFLANGVIVGTASLSGESATLSASNLPAGAVSLQAVYSGDSINALSVSAAQSVSVAASSTVRAKTVAGPSKLL
jgi:hypothetical protein